MGEITKLMMMIILLIEKSKNFYKTLKQYQKMKIDEKKEHILKVITVS